MKKLSVAVVIFFMLQSFATPAAIQPCNGGKHSSALNKALEERLVYMVAYSKGGKILYMTELFFIPVDKNGNKDSKISDQKVKDFKEKVKTLFNDETSYPNIVKGSDNDDTKLKYQRDKDYETANGRSFTVFKL